MDQNGLESLIKDLKNVLSVLSVEHNDDPRTAQLILDIQAKLQYLIRQTNSPDASDNFSPNQLQDVNFIGSVIGNGRIDVGGDIIGGDKVIIYGADLLTEQQDTDALWSYLYKLLKGCEVLDLRAIDSQAVRPYQDPMRLSQVYVQPNVMERIAFGEDRLGNSYRIPIPSLKETRIDIIGDWEMVPMTTYEFIELNKRAILLGDPGSGKSSVVNYLVYLIANNAITSDAKLLVENGLKSFVDIPHIPILVKLDDYASSEHFGSTARDVWNYVIGQLGLLIDASKPLLKALNKGRAFVIFDGLDELSSDSIKIALRSINDLGNTYPDNRYLITSRVLEYERIKGVDMIGYNTSRLAPLTVEQISAFISRWYSEARIRNWGLRPGLENELLHSLRSPDLGALAKNPLLLTQIALLHSSYGILPEDRVNLYDEVSKLLLTRWERRSSPEFSIAEYLKIPDLRLSSLEMALLEVAYKTFEANGPVPIRKADVIETLQLYLNEDWGKAQKFCEYVEMRAGLLIAQSDGRFNFPHPTFHEFLAAKYLSLQNDFNSRSADLVISDPNKWRRVYCMAIKLAGIDRGSIAIGSLIYDNPPDITSIHTIRTEQWQSSLVAGDAIVELGVAVMRQRPERLQVLKRVVSWLACIIQYGQISIRERIDAANTLGKIGDPRKGVVSLEPDLALISQGGFKMNTPRGFSKDQEIDNYQIDIPYDYWISKYLVTQWQYSLFLSENKDYKVPQGAEGYSWSEENRQPPKERLNHPVVLVSWIDAKSYCIWLDSKLRKFGLIPDDYEIRLPTEAEWEKAMHGGDILDKVQNPLPCRKYPWGDKIQEDHANLPNVDPILSETTPVGVFPKGASPYGILDMAGNAMEWTQTSWGSSNVDDPGFDAIYSPLDGRNLDDAPGYKVLRGGSWLFAEGGAQCSCRLEKDARYADVGFRIAIAPRKMV